MYLRENLWKVILLLLMESLRGLVHMKAMKSLMLKGKFIVPGFIDGHVHIESSMLTPTEFAKVVLQHGVTTVITDPHEIGNVAGTDGIQYMLEDAKQLPLDIFVMLPSCVPTTPFETNGARLDAEQLQPFLSKPEVLGLAEVMDFPSVSAGNQTMLDKIAMTLDLWWCD